MNVRVGSRPPPWHMVLGLSFWLGTSAVVQPGWGASLFLFAPLVAVPLALSALAAAIWSRWILFTAALFLIPAYGLDQGPLAACCTLPWLMVCGGMAVERLLHWPITRDTAFLFMCGFLTIGSGWLLIARLGMRPLGFEDVIVHATAVHFHYAGFVLPALLLRLGQADRSMLTRLALAGVLGGVPLVAAGITLTVWRHRWLESTATLLLAWACLLTAWRQARFSASVTAVLPKAMMLASSAALATAMTLASLYAVGQWFGTPWLDIPFMLRVHGCLQAFGFALPALLAWRLIDVPARVPVANNGTASKPTARLA